MTQTEPPAPATPTWPAEIYEVLREADVTQVSYVPDAGHTEMIAMSHEDPEVFAVPLTTEEEGIGLAAGAWLGGKRAVLLMQSSGVGNCVNMFGLIKTCNLPFLTLISMRGEWGETNPWQLHMGRNTQPLLEQSGFTVYRVEQPEAAADTVRAACQLAFLATQPVAVLLTQRLIGAKVFKE
jgi:sulfopyruvate decarboxylase alpha subunit